MTKITNGFSLYLYIFRKKNNFEFGSFVVEISFTRTHDAKANNSYLGDTSDPKKSAADLWYIEVNSLYSWAI